MTSSKKIEYSPFKTCVNGHDTTTPGAFIYVAGANRMCRQCNEDKNKKPGSRSKERSTIGAFDG